MKALYPNYYLGSNGGNRRSIFKDYELPTTNKESIRQHLMLVFSR
jgi:hypothetical protein